MDKAQAKARRYLTVAEILSDLSAMLDSPLSSISELLLQRIKLQDLQLRCQVHMEPDPQQKLWVALPKYAVVDFLQRLISPEHEELEDLKYRVHFFRNNDGKWEIPHPHLMPILLQDQQGQQYDDEIPFSVFRVPKVELQDRLRDANVDIPEWWEAGEKPINQHLTRAEKKRQTKKRKKLIQEEYEKACANYHARYNILPPKKSAAIVLIPNRARFNLNDSSLEKYSRSHRGQKNADVRRRIEEIISEQQSRKKEK